MNSKIDGKMFVKIFSNEFQSTCISQAFLTMRSNVQINNPRVYKRSRGHKATRKQWSPHGEVSEKVPDVLALHPTASEYSANTVVLNDSGGGRPKANAPYSFHRDLVKSRRSLAQLVPSQASICAPKSTTCCVETWISKPERDIYQVFRIATIVRQFSRLLWSIGFFLNSAAVDQMVSL